MRKETEELKLKIHRGRKKKEYGERYERNRVESGEKKKTYSEDSAKSRKEKRGIEDCEKINMEQREA